MPAAAPPDEVVVAASPSAALAVVLVVALGGRRCRVHRDLRERVRRGRQVRAARRQDRAVHHRAAAGRPGDPADDRGHAAARTPSPTPRPTLVSLEPGADPGADADADPARAGRRHIVNDPEAVFAHELRKDWCAPAGVQMTLAILGLGDTSERVPARARRPGPRVGDVRRQPQLRLGPVGDGRSRSRPTARRATRSAPTRPASDALRDAAVAIETTGSPAILLAWRGAHTWVMTGYRADADPARLPRRDDQRHLHPRPVVPVELVDLGPVRPARDVPGRRRDGAQLPALEAARGPVPGPRRQVHLVVPTLPAPTAPAARRGRRLGVASRSRRRPRAARHRKTASRTTLTPRPAA